MHWLLLILTSTVLMAVWTLLLKRDMKYEVNTQVIAISALAGLCLTALFFNVDYALLFSSSGWIIFLKTGIVALSVFCHTLALKRMPVSLYAPLRNLSPVFLLFLGAFFLGEMIGPLQLVGLVVVLTGAVLLDVDIRKKHVWRQLRLFVKNPAVILLLLSAFIISFAPILDRIVLNRAVSVPTTLFFYYAFLVFIYWVLHFVRERRLPVQGLSLYEWGWLLLTGVTLALSDFALLYAYTIPGTILVVLIGIRRLSNLLATVFGGAFFHEEHLWYKGVICAFMILGTVLLVT